MTIHDSISIGVKLSENLFGDSQNIYCINVGQHSNNHSLSNSNPGGGLYRFIKTDVSRGTLAEVTGNLADSPTREQQPRKTTHDRISIRLINKKPNEKT